MFKIFYTHQKKKSKFPLKKKMSDAHAKACAKGIIFSNETIFYTHLEKPIFRLKKFLHLPEKKISWNNFSTGKEFLILPQKIQLSNRKNYHTFQKKSDFRRKKYLIFVRKKLEVSYIYPHPHTPPPPPLSPVKKRFVIQKKSNILHFRRVLNTALLLF